MPINQDVALQINAHLPLEAKAQWVYQRFALDANTHGYFGCEAYFKAQSADEACHLHSLIGFINDFDAENALPAVDAIASGLNATLDSMFTTALEMEQTVTASLSRICSAAMVVGDWLSVQFLHAFIVEQRKSEVEYRDILNRLAMATANLIEFDEWIGELAGGGK